MNTIIHHSRRVRWLRISAVSALVSLSLMMWSFFDPRPIPMVVFMTIGQGLGTASLGLFFVVIASDLRKTRVLRAPIGERDSGSPEAR